VVRRFFTSVDGFLHHKRVDQELANASINVEQRRAAGKASWKARKQQKQQHELNGRSNLVDVPLDVCSASVDVSLAVPLEHFRRPSPSPSPRKEEEEATLRVDKKPTQGRRLPDDWVPGEAGVAFAREHNLNPGDTFDQFRDYWLSAAGRTANKVDWDAAWRYWCRNAKNRPISTRPAAKSATSQWADLYGIKPGDSLTLDQEGNPS
jgi:hypothetical protein